MRIPMGRLGGVCLILLEMALSSASCAAAEAKVEAYGEIENYNSAALSPEERDALKKYGFVVVSEAQASIHDFYNLKAGSGREPLRLLPPLVTTDVMLHVYHVIFEKNIELLEAKQLLHLKRWNAYLWKLVSADVRGGLSADELAHLRGLVAVGRCLAEPEWSPPENTVLPPWVEGELERIRQAEGRVHSDAWCRDVDYAVFRPRGFYDRKANLRHYFRSWIWWSRFPFRVSKPGEVQMAVALARELYDNADYKALVSAYSEILGASECPNLCDLRVALDDSWSPEGDHQAELDAAITLLKDRFHPLIRTGYRLDELSEPGELHGIYVLAPAYSLDSAVFTQVTTGVPLMARVPSGLDLMAVLGGQRIEDLLLSEAQASARAPLHEAIRDARARLMDWERFSEIGRLTYVTWQALLAPEVGSRHPPFMRTEAYRNKSLQTALAGWAEHRHQWLLHIERSASGGGRVFPAGFVEPNVPFWFRLLELTLVTQENLSAHGLNDPRWMKYSWILRRCHSIAKRQLAQEGLGRTEREFFHSFGDNLGELLDIGDSGCSVKRPRVVVADVHHVTDPAMTLHVGTGLPQAIYAVIPYQGKRWLCKGGVMTYREYVTKGGQTLTDEDWRAILTGENPPPRPQWTKDFCFPPNVPGQEAP